ncbi:spore coat protein GerQ [Paenibacillus sp. FSL H8-0548]|uniref:spore coat protein GerQ n=1 Tax=Paenibacillus sp. FSL H8-0548 TaxID=1920422 RepID=UPI00096EEE33|nr:spore coat protein GerQ [Paenibacillus sp. FSL H8-0548]
MSNGYGFKNQVSPANTAPYQGYGYGGYGGYPQQMGMQQPQATAFPAQAMQMAPPAVPSGAFVTPAGGNIVTLPAIEESYVENILRLNRGKMATFYMTYENNREWNAKIFKGVIEAAGRDHIVISDPSTGMRYLLLTLNLDYVTFDGPIAYEYPFHGSVVSSSTPLGTATLGTANSSR